MPARNVLLCTEKPFAAGAVTSIEATLKEQGYECTKLEGYKSKDDVLPLLKEADAVIVRSDKIGANELDAGKEGKLKLIVRAGAGVDTIDLNAATTREMVVMNTPGQNSNAVAELAFGMMIMNARNRFDGTSGYELRGKSLALHGFGQVARNMHRLAAGFEMDVVAYDPFLKKEDIEKTGAKAASTVEELFSCNFVSLHIPCTDETRNSINSSLLQKLPKNGVLINTARKEVIHEAELLSTFQARPDLRYLSDVVPDNMDDIKEKLGDNQVFCTPKKMGAQTAEANNNAGIAAAKQIIDFFEKNDTRFQVNKPGKTF